MSIFLENHLLFYPPSIPLPTNSDEASMECALDTSCVVDGVGVDKSKSDLISSSTSTNGSVHYSRSVSKMICYSISLLCDCLYSGGCPQWFYYNICSRNESHLKRVGF